VDKYMDQLMAPAFMKNPPVKLDIPAKTLGLVYAILGALGVLFGLFGLFAALGLSAVATAVGVGGVWILLLIGGLVSLVGTALAAWGGYKMYQGDHAAKRTVVMGLVISLIGGLISALGTFGGGLPGWIISALITFVLYYLVIISRFSDEKVSGSTA
jgi:hypothetical protein